MLLNMVHCSQVCLNPFHYKRVQKDVFVRRPHPENPEHPDQIFHVYRTYSTAANGVQVLCQYCLTRYDGRAKARQPDAEPLEERDPVVNTDSDEAGCNDSAAADTNGDVDTLEELVRNQPDTGAVFLVLTVKKLWSRCNKRYGV